MSTDITRYPDATLSDALNDDEKTEILEFSLPPIWRTHMKLLMWECAGKSQAEIVEFCKKLEEYELENGVLESTKSYKERDQRASHNPTTHQPHDSGKTSRRKQKDQKRKSAQVTFPSSLRDAEKEVVNQDNIYSIHRDIAVPHTASECAEIKRSRKEYLETRKKWSGSSK